MTSEATVGRFDASVASLSPVRRLVSDMVLELGCEPLIDDAVLCASELASNAILHTRMPFDVDVHQVEDGVRIVVTDRRPEELPAVVPTTGIATDITSQGTTGRGLQIVASLADRWGVTADDHSKSVWVELRPSSRKERVAPVVVSRRRPPHDDDQVTLRFVSMPVRAAVASGMHLDGLVRELQLDAGAVDDEVLHRLYALLDESAPLRLEGRRKALEAASRDEPRYDLTVHATPRALAATAELNELMNDIGRNRRSVQPPTGVATFRAWLRDETRRQLRGLDPEPCRLA